MYNLFVFSSLLACNNSNSKIKNLSQVNDTIIGSVNSSDTINDDDFEFTSVADDDVEASKADLQAKIEKLNTSIAKGIKLDEELAKAEHDSINKLQNK